MALPIAAPTDTGTVEFGYTDFGNPGEVIEDSVEERLGIRRIRFANGVRLNLKSTDISKDRISVRVAVDGGELMATKDDPLKVYLAGSLTAGGLGKHSVDELRTVLAGRSVGYGFGAGVDTFNLGARTTPRDLELQMQLLAAFLTDPGYRAEGVERFRQGIDNFFQTRDSTPDRALSTALGKTLSDGDPRFSLQSKEAYFALDFDGLKDAIGDRLANGAIEIALVGDLDEAAAIAAVAATFGAMPTREEAFLPREEARERTFTDKRGTYEITHKGEDDQALVRLIWPTTDDSDLNETLKLNMLARIMSLELTDRLREELGQAYSPSAGASSSHFYRDYGTILINASVDVEQVPAAREAINTMLTDLAANAITPDVIERARKPLLEDYDNALKGLGGWMALTEHAQSEPERIDRFFNAPDLLKAFTPDDMKAMAAKYLQPGTAVEFIVTPKSAPACDSDEGCAAPESIRPSAPAIMAE